MLASNHCTAKSNERCINEDGTRKNTPSKLTEVVKIEHVDYHTKEETSSTIRNRLNIPERISFPTKLYNMLEDAYEKGFQHIVSWNTAGNGFSVHDKSKFLTKVIPLYFSNQSKYKSFQRQLSLYGFSRITHGRSKGERYHKDFIRGLKHRCKQIKPVAAATIKPTKDTTKNPDSFNMKHQEELQQQEQQQQQQEEEQHQRLNSASTMETVPTYSVTYIHVGSDKTSNQTIVRGNDEQCPGPTLYEPLQSNDTIPVTTCRNVTPVATPVANFTVLDKGLDHHHKFSMVPIVPKHRNNVGFFEGKSFYLMDSDFMPITSITFPAAATTTTTITTTTTTTTTKEPTPLHQPRLYVPTHEQEEQPHSKYNAPFFHSNNSNFYPVPNVTN